MVKIASIVDDYVTREENVMILTDLKIVRTSVSVADRLNMWLAVQQFHIFRSYCNIINGTALSPKDVIYII